jgi:hypothetical protein
MEPDVDNKQAGFSLKNAQKTRGKQPMSRVAFVFVLTFVVCGCVPDVGDGTNDDPDDMWPPADDDDNNNDNDNNDDDNDNGDDDHDDDNDADDDDDDDNNDDNDNDNGWGACCVPILQSCLNDWQTVCPENGVWHEGQTCGDEPCSWQSGACCYTDNDEGECYDTSQNFCNFVSGIWHNADSCEDFPCGWTGGACCLIGECADDFSAAKCANMGGSWYAGWTCGQIEGQQCAGPGAVCSVKE